MGGGRDSMTLTRLRYTSAKWIAHITVHAATNWIVIDCAAHGIYAANTRTRIDTLLIDARFIGRTF